MQHSKLCMTPSPPLPGACPSRCLGSLQGCLARLAEPEAPTVPDSGRSVLPWGFRFVCVEVFMVALLCYVGMCGLGLIVYGVVGLRTWHERPESLLENALKDYMRRESQKELASK